MTQQRRLVLYSTLEAPNQAAMAARIRELFRTERPRLAYVSAAPDLTRWEFEGTRGHYATSGIELAIYLDQQTLSHSTASSLLAGCDGLHLGGGNTFSFLYWLRAQGLLAVLRDWVAQGKILIGVSAGAILMTPAIGTAALCGDALDPRLDDESGLGLVDFHVWPHAELGAEQRLDVVARLASIDALYACADGGGLVVDGDSIQCFGPVRRWQGGRWQRPRQAGDEPCQR